MTAINSLKCSDKNKDGLPVCLSTNPAAEEHSDLRLGRANAKVVLISSDETKYVRQQTFFP